MNFIKIKFGNNLDDEFQRAVDEVFDLFNPVQRRRELNWIPNIDICESKDEYIILMDIAGLVKEDLRVELGGRKIKFTGVRRIIPDVENTRYCLAEIPHGYFERTVALPAAVDAESAVASYVDGILIIKISKLPE